MPISTPLMELLGARYPIILGAMDLVADARLTRTVSKDGGFGILGAGYGEPVWLERELTTLEAFHRSERLEYGVGSSPGALPSNQACSIGPWRQSQN